MSATLAGATHWVVAVPNDIAGKVVDKFRSAMIEKAGKPLADVSVLEVPMMKVGTLDSLMTLSDELGRVDSFIEGVLKKVERQVAESYVVLKTQDLAAKRKADDVRPIVVPALGLRCAGKPVHDYVARFKWDANTWDPKESLPEQVKRMATAAERIDADMRQYTNAYTEKKTALQAADRKRSGNLMVASLDDVITPATLKAADAEWLDGESSEFLASVAVVVAKAGEAAFLEGYTAYAGDAVPVGPEGKREAEKTGPAVPGSARRVSEDKDGYALYVLVVLKKYVEAFKGACKERRVVVRDFTLMPGAAGAAGKAGDALARETAGALSLLKDVSRARYEEVVSLWMHAKAVRVFVESVLKYALPVSFTAVLFRLHREGGSGPGNARKLQDAVVAAWGSMSSGSRLLDEGVATAGARAGGEGEEEDDGKADPVIAGITDAPGAAFPFVLIDWELRPDTSGSAQK